MHITFLVHDIHFGGGGERVTVNMANHFADKGNEVTIVSLTTRKNENIFNIDSRVNIDYLNIKLYSGLKIIRKIESYFAVKRFFHKVNCQTFLLGIGNYPTLLATLLPTNEQLIKIGCQHGSYASVKHMWVILRWLLFRKLNAIVSLTEYDVPKLRKLNKNVWVIPNSITFYPDKPAELKNRIILSVGRIDFPKGYDLLIEMFGRFCLINKDWKLRIIGDGPLKETIRRIISDKKLTERVSIIASSNKIIEEYLNASVYLMTSRTEGLPMVLLEAQGCGLPIISFNCETGPSDIINNGIDGYLIDNYDIDKMNHKLTELCSDSNRRREFGQNARKNAEKYFPEKVFFKWEALFANFNHK
jgi:amylovoran biosynthesis glycosyltransferase AmsD